MVTSKKVRSKLSAKVVLEKIDTMNTKNIAPVQDSPQTKANAGVNPLCNLLSPAPKKATSIAREQSQS